MRIYVKRIRRFFGSEDGPAAVEYAVLLALVLLGGVSAAQSIGCNMVKPIANTAESISQ